MSGSSRFGRKLSCKRRESSDDDIYNVPTQAPSQSTTTPVRMANPNPSEDEESPYFPCSTQEIQDEVDVLWKWNSPQMKQFQSKRPKKRIVMQRSPKIPLRRHPSADAQSKKDFEKLREELRALREELNQPEDEESLILSPREERAIKDEADLFENSIMDEMHKHLQEPWESDTDDVFNDNMDDIMIQCSQQIEEVLKTSNPVNNVIVINSSSTSKSSGHSNNKFGLGSSRDYNEKNQPPTINKTNIKLNCEIPTKEPHTSERRISPAINNLINSKPKYNFKKTTAPISSVPKNLTPSQEMVTFDRIFHPLVQEKKQEASSAQKITISNQYQPKNLDTVFDDSFDMILSKMPDDDLDQLTQVVDIKSHNQLITNDTNSRNFNKSNFGSSGFNSGVGTHTTNGNRLSSGTHTTRGVGSLSYNSGIVGNRVVGPLTNNQYSRTTNKLHLQNSSTNNRILTPHGPNLVQNSNQKNKKPTVFPRCNSDGMFSSGGHVQTATGKVEFHRTQSFEISTGTLAKNKMEVDKSKIELSRTNSVSDVTDSQIRCSHEEIEKKRLAALALREAKRQREIIEKNRQEALKKLEEKRMRNAQLVKSSLVKRL